MRDVEDGEDDRVEVVGTACGSWLKDGECVDVVESGGGSWLEVDSEVVGDCVVVLTAAAKFVV